MVDRDPAPQPHPRLPRRVVGANLPADFHLNAVAIGRAKADGQSGSRWATDEKAVRFLLNGLRRWQPKSREEPDR